MTEFIRKKPVRPRLIGLHFQNFTPEQKYCVPDAHGYCSTCSDEALPARVTELNEDQFTALVEINGRSAEVDVSLIDDIAVGQHVLVHGGVAIGLVDPGDR